MKTPISGLTAILTLWALSAAAQSPIPSRTLPACTTVGQQVTLTIDTGTGGPPPTADPFWTLPAATPYTTSEVSPPTLWLFNGTNYRWIQPAATGVPAISAATTYVYSTKFWTPLDPYLYSSITVSGLYAGDDNVVVKLNGVPIASCTSTTSSACFHLWQPLPTVSVDWQKFNRLSGPPYLNTLTVEVKNTSTSYTGLIMQAKVIAVCSRCTTVPPPCGGNPSNC